MGSPISSLQDVGDAEQVAQSENSIVGAGPYGKEEVTSANRPSSVVLIIR